MKNSTNKKSIPPECRGEKCAICQKQACAKVGEEILSSDPNPYRHNLTAYVCEEHFKILFGREV